MRLRAAAALHRGETVETGEWGTGRQFPGWVIVEDMAGALQTASEWRWRDTIWTDGSRIESEEVGAACIGQSPSGWTGRRFHLGTNKK